MYILHIANKNYSSWSLRPWLLMKTLSIPFEERLSPFSEGSNWSAFRQFSPTGLVPSLTAKNEEIWESLAIVEYLADLHDGVWPEDRKARAWARSASAEMHAGFSALRNQCPMNCGLKVKLANIDDALKKDITRVDELWRDGLAHFGGPYLAGKTFTAVDAFFAPVIFRIQSFQLPMSERAQEYMQQMLALPAMQQWYEEALQETWREPAHEKECHDAGEVIEDLRQA